MMIASAIPYPENYEYVINEWKERRIKAVEAMKLMNENPDEDFELVGAQVFYNLQGKLR